MCDGPKVYLKKERVSNKTHKCSECGGTIFYKERYTYFRGLWDDHWSTVKTCTDCVRIRKQVESQLTYCEYPYLGELQDAIVDGGDVELLEEYISVKDRRGCEVPKWLRTQLRENKRKR